MTDAKPAFWLTRCPRCLAALKPPQQWTDGKVWAARCWWCQGLTDREAQKDYEQRLGGRP